MSGDQIIRAVRVWDRVHGVNHEREAGAVVVTTDRACGVRYDLGTLVEVV